MEDLKHRAKVGNHHLTVKEAADILKCSSKSIRNYYNADRLKYEKAGERKILIHRSSVEALLKKK